MRFVNKNINIKPFNKQFNRKEPAIFIPQDLASKINETSSCLIYVENFKSAIELNNIVSWNPIPPSLASNWILNFSHFVFKRWPHPRGKVAVINMRAKEPHICNCCSRALIIIHNKMRGVILLSACAHHRRWVILQNLFYMCAEKRVAHTAIFYSHTIIIQCERLFPARASGNQQKWCTFAWRRE